jgi:toluene monooxygenase system ferredoxin subunit
MVTPATLAQTVLFEGLAETQLAAFSALAEEITCAPGRAIFKEGDPATKLYILLEGKVSIQVALTSRPETISIAVLNQPGSVVGWSGFLPENRYTAAAMCQADSRLLVFDGAAFMRVLESDPALGFVIMRRIADVISSRLRNIQRFVLKTL